MASAEPERFFTLSPDLLCIFDMEGRFRSVNPAVRRILGYSPDELIGTSALDYLHPDDIDASGRVIAELQAGHALNNFLNRYRCLNGSYKWILWEAAVYSGHIYAAGRDITNRKRAEQNAEETHQFLQSTLDALASHIAVLDEEGNIIAVNDAWREFAAQNEDLMDSCAIGSNYLQACEVPGSHYADEAERAAQGIRDVIANRQSTFSLEYACQSPVEQRWFALNVTRFSGEGPLRVVVAHDDITERKNSEFQLARMHEELEERVAERTAELARANAALQVEMAEREQAEAVIRTRARQQEAVAELGRRVLTGIDMDTLLNEAVQLVISTLDVDTSAILELSPDGASLRVRAGAGFASDVSGAVISGAPASQAGYALQSNVPTIVTDLKNETRFCPSPLLLQRGIVSGVTVIVGGYEHPFGTLEAHTVKDRRFSQDDVHFLLSMANVLAAALARNNIESEIRQLNDQFKVTNEQLRIENIDRQMAMGALREVTAGLEEAMLEAQKAKQIAEMANRSKSEFLSRMSHELRTPMNAILGFGQLLQMSELGPDESESVEHILKGGRHLLQLINEVLDISRIEAGNMSLSPEPIRVADIVHEAIDLVRPLAAGRQIELKNAIAPEMNWHVLADSQRLKQVLLNILSNAVKYNREAGQVIVAGELRETPAEAEEACEAETVSTEAGTTEAGTTEAGTTEAGTTEAVRISIADTGPGLSQAELDKLFTPFERLSASALGIEGTGIGLALSKQLVEVMGGRVGVSSTVGDGSTFWIEFPLTTSPLDQTQNQDEELLAMAVSPPESIVLYIEDNLLNMILIEHILSKEKTVSMLSAMQGSIGLDLACQHHPDLILLDLHLPDIPGEEVLRRLQANPETRHIPVVVLSADATTGQIERLLEAGARAYLTKPLDLKKFLEVMTEILSEKSD